MGEEVRDAIGFAIHETDDLSVANQSLVNLDGKLGPARRLARVSFSLALVALRRWRVTRNETSAEHSEHFTSAISSHRECYVCVVTVAMPVEPTEIAARSRVPKLRRVVGYEDELRLGAATNSPCDMRLQDLLERHLLVLKEPIERFELDVIHGGGREACVRRGRQPLSNLQQPRCSSRVT